MNDPQTWTIGWGLTVGMGGGQGRGEQWGKIGTTVIEQQFKKLKLKEKEKEFVMRQDLPHRLFYCVQGSAVDHRRSVSERSYLFLAVLTFPNS